MQHCPRDFRVSRAVTREQRHVLQQSWVLMPVF